MGVGEGLIVRVEIEAGVGVRVEVEAGVGAGNEGPV